MLAHYIFAKSPLKELKFLCKQLKYPLLTLIDSIWWPLTSHISRNFHQTHNCWLCWSLNHVDKWREFLIWSLSPYVHHHFVAPFEVLEKMQLFMVCEETSWKRKFACTFYTCICCVDSLVVGWIKVMNTCICFVTILLNLLCLKNGQTIVLKTYL